MTILEKAAEIVSGDRQKQYGHVKDNFEMIARLWAAYLDIEVYADDVAHLMILLKIARAQGKRDFHEDSYVDIAGYSRCVEIIHHAYLQEKGCYDDTGSE